MRLGAESDEYVRFLQCVETVSPELLKGWTDSDGKACDGIRSDGEAVDVIISSSMSDFVLCGAFLAKTLGENDDGPVTVAG